MEEYSVIMPIAEADISVALFNIPYILTNLKPRKIYIIAKKTVEDSFRNIDKCFFIDEDSLYDGMNYDRIKKIVVGRCGSQERAGWYFQQFLKMAYAFHSENKYYLLWDADTIPLKKISIFDMDDKPMFALRTEYHKPYFDLIDRILGISKCVENSFIAEHMIIDREIMIEMIKKIEANQEVKGNTFYEKIINSIDIKELPLSGFSEFETYGTYVCSFHPGQYGFRTLKTCRQAKRLLGDMRDEKTLKWASDSFDTISFEKTDEQYKKGRIARFRIVQYICPMRILIKILFRYLY